MKTLKHLFLALLLVIPVLTYCQETERTANDAFSKGNYNDAANLYSLASKTVKISNPEKSKALEKKAEKSKKAAQHLSSGNSAWNAAKYPSAESHYKALQKLNSNDKTAKKRLAELATKQGYSQEEPPSSNTNTTNNPDNSNSVSSNTSNPSNFSNTSNSSNPNNSSNTSDPSNSNTYNSSSNSRNSRSSNSSGLSATQKQNLDKAMELYEKKNFAAALKYFEKALPVTHWTVYQRLAYDYSKSQANGKTQGSYKSTIDANGAFGN